MKWYLKVVSDNYANFTGRARREEYWMFVLFNIIFAITIAIISGMLVASTNNGAFMFFYVIYILGVFIPGLAVSVRRLHDINKSGWYYLVGIIPFLGAIWLIILFATEGDRGSNQYGPDPKNPTHDEINQIGVVS